MPNPLFATFKQGENRVTASILAVFERISFALVERIIQILCEEPNIPLLEIRNQIRLKGVGAVPDGAIQASFAYWIETKIVRDAIVHPHEVAQIERHLEGLQLSTAARKKLLVLTPDYEKPQAIKGLNSELVVWASFNDLYSAIAEITATNESWLTSDFSPPSEQERFLLRELVQMLLVERLINNGRPNDVLIVPARTAIHDYENFSVYVCQPNRSFRRVEYIGFYHSGLIDRRIAKILCEPVEEVELTKEGLENLTTPVSAEVKQKLIDLVDKLESDVVGNHRLGGLFKVFFLSPPVPLSDTIELTQDVKNDLKNEVGRPYPFTQSQRYVPLSALKKNPATTTELLTGQSA